ncbi:Radical SAM domain protein (plasmid) [Haloterrigena turkmenica DSM 5511]|uniref:Radical SAM domain protein n=1 Tax=Haloterrigena turkmenica (strain ATCC 51198 / DSM 5511 / JCM 9101 / NCIMB 13204 / VKM B-1734 / 4k) TaxID=543526 RepID=D2S026_HALTV|nr:mycofactocin radical SAM maturase [Haloterrigena turkmenica]ADB62723.1 Radical SAM domain protein [Haloterrigena turkmenica DSM 5511]
MPSGPLSAPVTITWEVTLGCNLHCDHCLSGSGPGHQQPDELSTEEAMAFIDELDEMDVFQVNIGGGEPFIRPDMLELLEELTDRDISTCVSTNGTQLDEETLDRIEAMDPLFLQVSMDGLREANDAIRGEGVYDQIVETLERLESRDIGTTVNTVVTRQNVYDLPDVYDLAEDHGAGLRLNRFRPSGRGEDTWDRFRLEQEQIEYLHGWLEERPDVRTGDSFFYLNALGEVRNNTLKECGAGSMTCLVDPVGDVYPCAFTQWDGLASGNVTEDGFQAAWDDIASLRNRIDDNEGCPAVAMGSDDPNGEDPQLRAILSGD